MPSSLTAVLSSALGFSPHPPVSVCGTDASSPCIVFFSEAPWATNGLAPSRPCLMGPVAYSSPSAMQLSGDYQRRRNINLLSIDYAFRPHLRIRLTLGGFTFPRKPGIFGEEDSHLHYRYSCWHSHLHAVQRSFRYAFAPACSAPLPLRAWLEREIRSFGCALESRSFSAQKSSTSKVLPTF